MSEDGTAEASTGDAPIRRWATEGVIVALLGVIAGGLGTWFTQSD